MLNGRRRNISVIGMSAAAVGAEISCRRGIRRRRDSWVESYPVLLQIRLAIQYKIYIRMSALISGVSAKAK